MPDTCQHPPLGYTYALERPSGRPKSLKSEEFSKIKCCFGGKTLFRAVVLLIEVENSCKDCNFGRGEDPLIICRLE